MAAGSHRNRFSVDGFPVFSCTVSHGSWGEIHLSCHHSDIREGDVVERHIVLQLRPSALFHTENTLVVQNIGVGTVQTHWLVEAVQV